MQRGLYGISHETHRISIIDMQWRLVFAHRRSRGRQEETWPTKALDPG